MNVDIYETDFGYVADMMKAVKALTDAHDGEPADTAAIGFINRAEFELRNVNDYAIGKLTYEDEQWRFTPADQENAWAGGES